MFSQKRKVGNALNEPLSKTHGTLCWAIFKDGLKEIYCIHRLLKCVLVLREIVQGSHFQTTLFWPRKELLLRSWFQFKRWQSPEHTVVTGLGHTVPSGPQGSVLSKESSSRQPWPRSSSSSPASTAVHPETHAPGQTWVLH